MYKKIKNLFNLIIIFCSLYTLQLSPMHKTEKSLLKKHYKQIRKFIKQNSSVIKIVLAGTSIIVPMLIEQQFMPKNKISWLFQLGGTVGVTHLLSSNKNNCHNCSESKNAWRNSESALTSTDNIPGDLKENLYKIEEYIKEWTEELTDTDLLEKWNKFAEIIISQDSDQKAIDEKHYPHLSTYQDYPNTMASFYLKLTIEKFNSDYYIFHRDTILTFFNIDEFYRYIAQANNEEINIMLTNAVCYVEFGKDSENRAQISCLRRGGLSPYPGI